MSKSSEEFANEYQMKFGFYLVALTFTLLGLSIQTAEFGSENCQNGFELAGWLSLFISGILGLKSLKMTPRLFAIFSVQVGPDKKAKVADSRLKTIERCYTAHWYLFVVGVGCIICARAYEPLLTLLANAAG